MLLYPVQGPGHLIFVTLSFICISFPIDVFKLKVLQKMKIHVSSFLIYSSIGYVNHTVHDFPSVYRFKEYNEICI